MRKIDENLVDRQTDRQTDRSPFYDFLRILLVACVVIGHGTYYNIVTQFGGIHYFELMQESHLVQPLFYKMTSLLTSYIYTFHMPVFIALSGSLWALGKEKSYCSLVQQKAKRLLIPFLIVWFAWNLPIKYSTGYYDGVPVWKILFQIILPAKVYLWYLECLFFIFVIFGLIRRLQRNQQKTIVCLLWLVGVFLYRKLGQYHPVGDPLYYLGWFYIGYRIEDIVPVLKRKHLWNNFSVSALFVLHVAIFLADRYFFTQKIIGACCKYLLLPLFMFLVLNYFVRALNLKRNGKWLEKASGYGMGIYLYAEPLNYMFLYLFYTHCGVEYFGTNVGAATIYFSRIIITPIIAVAITAVFKRLRLKYLY